MSPRVEVQTTVLDEPNDTYDDATFDVDDHGALHVYHLADSRDLTQVGIYAPGAWLRARTVQEDQ
jgi:hypothetical protein